MKTGDIGGALGFYLGGSVLTVMEIIDILFIKLLAKVWKKRCTKKKGTEV